MEFMLTYGWAITVVVVAIAALAYFGVLDMGNFAPSMCTLPQGLSCVDHRVYEQGITNRLEMNIKNNLGAPIHITAVDIEVFNDKNSIQDIALNNGKATQSPNNVLVMDLTDVAHGGSKISPGAEYDFDFTITYTNTDSNLPHTVMGHVTGKVN